MKNRLIFTLYYKDGFFCVSRNFRLQKVGDFNWLIRNFGITENANHFDELVLLNLSSDGWDSKEFFTILRYIANHLFLPISAGGGISNLNDAAKFIYAGADKVIINSLFFEQYDEVRKISNDLGRQAIVFSLDYKFENGYKFYYSKGKTLSKYDLNTIIEFINKGQIGECMLTNINYDGAGLGYDIKNVNELVFRIIPPTIINGGGSTPDFVKEAFLEAKSNAVSISDLYNFMGSSISDLRQDLILSGTPLPMINDRF
jgi:cyclase